MSRYVLVMLIVLGLALLGLTLVRSQAQSAEDALPHQDGASCVTVCPLHDEDGSLSPMAGQPSGDEHEIGPEDFASPDMDYRLPAQESLLDRYLPVTLHITVGPAHDKSP
jgi:hypothetical protein